MPSEIDRIALQEALLGRYSLERELGRGGMGTVYLARDLRLDRPVAIKVLHPDLAARTVHRERFLHEARTAAGLSHPNIVPILAVEECDSYILIVMGFVLGETLSARLRDRGPLKPSEAERMIREVAWALSYAHAHGVIHRDITLANIMLERDSGRAVLLDFGLAGPQEGEADAPRFGTPGFIAPEVIRGEPAGVPSDLYSLGVVAWTAIAGRPPFIADTPEQLLAKHLLQPVPPLTAAARGVSRRLVTSIEQCLAKVASERPRDTSALLAMLERAPEQAALAPALHAWFTRWEIIAPIYAILTPLLFVLIGELPPIHRPTTMAVLLYIMGVLKLSLVGLGPVLIQGVFEVISLRKLRAAGFGIDDLRAAWPLNTDRLIREREREGLRPLASRVLTDLTVIGVVVCAIMYLVMVPFVLPQMTQWSRVGVLLLRLADVLPQVAAFSTLGLTIGLFSPGFRFKPNGWVLTAASRFWHAPIAGTLARLATISQARGLPTGTLHRPTALVLGLAIDDLWKAMPPSLREGLGDVPSLTRTLQASAEELRELMNQLRPSTVDGSGDTALDRTLAQAEQALEVRHRETVTMLEQLRLELLRMLATRQQTQELTQQLDAARHLETALLGEVAGHDAVRRLLRRPKRSGLSTPATPTPAAA